MSKIHFIGTYHFDPSGSERLWNALSYEKPDAIAVECSPELWRYFVSGIFFKEEKRILKEYQKMGMSNLLYINMLGKLKDTLFEPRVCFSYGISENVQVHFVDSKVVFNEILTRHKSDRSIGLEDVATRADKNFRSRIAENRYYEFNKLFNKNNSALGKYFSMLNNAYMDRDDFAEEKIRSFVKSIDKLVVVYGLAHCLHDNLGQSLFSRLSDLNPTRRTLEWYGRK